MKWILKPAELAWRGVNRVRRAMYRAGILRARALPCPVISIGNISVGGGGKTPAVIAIARALTERGLHVGVLTRGYGRTGGSGPVDTLDAARFGDEPVLIKKSVPKATVLVGANRYLNALAFNCDVYVLDDGFQHMQIRRDLDVVVDVADAALLRESRSALRHADIVVPRKLRLRIPDSLRGKKVFAFAGLANNDQFFESLVAEGVHLAGTRGLPDHHRYSPADIDAIKRDGAGADAIVTTEKDAVKIQDSSIVAIPAEFEFEPGVLDRILAVATR